MLQVQHVQEGPNTEFVESACSILAAGEMSRLYVVFAFFSFFLSCHCPTRGPRDLKCYVNVGCSTKVILSKGQKRKIERKSVGMHLALYYTQIYYSPQ